MRLLRIGEAAAAVLATSDTGQVVGVFRRAVYLSFPAGMVALVDQDAEPGPLHAHVSALPGVSVGDAVRAHDGNLRIADTTAIWRPPPAPSDLASVVPILRAVLDHVPDLDLTGGAGPAIEERLSAALRHSGLPAIAPALAGRGAGLTPAGDDVLAGLLLVARIAAGPTCEARLVALARGAGTHEISHAYLTQAARGSSLAALHDLVCACAEGNVGEARAARARLARVGRSSGLDLAYGVLIGSVNWATAPWLAQRRTVNDLLGTERL
jgi:hypothetical protein